MRSLDPSDLSALPTLDDSGVLLHIGVHKTGTTALQESFWLARQELQEQSVLFRGPRSWRPVSLMDVYNGSNRRLAAEASKTWRKLREAVQGFEGRAFVSSESLCMADDIQARDIVERLGNGRRVAVLITARAIAQLLPSQWQQLLKHGQCADFDTWLREVWAEPRPADHLFWCRFTFAALISRWSEVVGEDNVHFVMTDRGDPDRAIRVAEHLLEVRSGTVALAGAKRVNSSMSFTEAEFLRQVNLALVPAKLSRSEYKSVMRLGAFAARRRPEEPRVDPIPLPSWAAELAVSEALRQQRDISRTGVWGIGEIAGLSAPYSPVVDQMVSPEMVPMQTATQAVVGTVLSKTPGARRKRATLRERLGEVKRSLKPQK